MSIYSHEFLIFSHVNSQKVNLSLLTGNMNNFLSLNLTKLIIKLVLTTRVISHNAQYEKFEMKLPGCEILGTAARTLAPLTNFPRAAESPFKSGVTGYEFARRIAASFYSAKLCSSFFQWFVVQGLNCM